MQLYAHLLSSVISFWENALQECISTTINRAHIFCEHKKMYD